MKHWESALERGRSLFRVDLGPVLSLSGQLQPKSWDKWLIGAQSS
jgi:hypothetical protein